MAIIGNTEANARNATITPVMTKGCDIPGGINVVVIFGGASLSSANTLNM